MSKEFLKEIIFSQSRNSLTQNAKDILKDLADRQFKASIIHYPNLQINRFYNSALNYMYSKFDKFNPDKGNEHPFAFFDIIFRNSLLLSAYNYKKNRNTIRKKTIEDILR